MRATKLVRSSPTRHRLLASLLFLPLGRLTTSKEAWRPLKWLDWQSFRRRRDGASDWPQNTFSLHRSGLSPVRLDTQRDPQCISFAREDRRRVRGCAVKKTALSSGVSPTRQPLQPEAS